MTDEKVTVEQRAWNAVAEQLEQALVDRNTGRFHAVAFVYRHEIIAALRTPYLPAGDVEMKKQHISIIVQGAMQRRGLVSRSERADAAADAILAALSPASIPAEETSDNLSRTDHRSGNLLQLDDARFVLFDAIRKIEIGNPTDDKLILENMRKAGFWITRLPGESIPAEPDGGRPFCTDPEDGDHRWCSHPPDNQHRAVSPSYVEEAVAAERERCARVVELYKRDVGDGDDSPLIEANDTCDRIAAAIRASSHAGGE